MNPRPDGLFVSVASAADCSPLPKHSRHRRNRQEGALLFRLPPMRDPSWPGLLLPHSRGSSAWRLNRTAGAQHYHNQSNTQYKQKKSAPLSSLDGTKVLLSSASPNPAPGPPVCFPQDNSPIAHPDRTSASRDHLAHHEEAPSVLSLRVTPLSFLFRVSSRT